MKISIVVPVYNAEEYLEVCFRSIIKQTFFNWELLVVNDGSTDSSCEICEYFSNKDKRIKIIQSNNQGPGIARNIGMSYATGDYLMFMDSDDYLEHNSLELLEKIASNTEAEIIFYPNYTDKMEDEKYKVVKDNHLKDMEFLSNSDFVNSYRLLYEHGYLHPVWNKLYKLSFIHLCNAIFPSGINVSEDYIFNIQLYKHLQKGVVLSVPLYHYVSRNSGSITSSFNNERFNSSKKVYLYSKKFFEDWNEAELIHVNNEFITNINVCINNLFNDDCKLSRREKFAVIQKIINDKFVKDCSYSSNLKGLRNRLTAFLVRNKQKLILMGIGKLTRSIGKLSK
ncbi:glycosyltransferase family 2 protein [Caldibacillus lycopersici]|uniref:Glycosyltransferase family 2 protein n=1 Tax=Perspicuibacillus lycopersici TaxID=1325689 RepID=A0AAE3LM44_9BACI|nr:glycosyltransferase family 2 protein [Perspicuibacillus lycopersici]MCU9612327.1 glycosyltransferase family 2 protein [Perspicuibacillus lycopersici]